MKNKVLRLALITLALALAMTVGGCGKKKVASDELQAVPTATRPAIGGGLAEAEEEGGMAAVEEPLLSEPRAQVDRLVLEGRSSAPMLPIYFDFDRSNIREDQRARIEQNADYLKANPEVAVQIEGNCDERGTNEYNMALGERRAQSTGRYLTNLGINKNRVKTISYGEEKSLVYGHDELSWAQNRRADFVILD